MLNPNAESDRTEMKATHQRMDSMNTRLDELVNYLMQKDGQ
jgi:tetrahydromethanopterin S-methyltransferase subunit G